MKTNEYVVAAVETLKVKERVTNSQPIHKPRVAHLAERLGRQGWAAAEAEVLNEALMKLIELCYVQEHGQRINVDPHSGRIVPELPVPWNSKNFKRYGLRRREQADVLRWVMLYHSRRENPLFWYNKGARRWHLNLRGYPSLAHALEWMSLHELNASRWLSALDQLSPPSRTPAHLRKI